VITQEKNIHHSIYQACHKQNNLYKYRVIPWNEARYRIMSNFSLHKISFCLRTHLLLFQWFPWSPSHDMTCNIMHTSMKLYVVRIRRQYIFSSNFLYCWLQVKLLFIWLIFVIYCVKYSIIKLWHKLAGITKIKV
jgi:hypothetical protein